MTRKTLDFSIRRSGRVALDFSDLVPRITNETPIAIAQSLTTPFETALPITLTGTDADVGDTLTYSVVLQPDWGVLEGTAPNLTYVPNDDHVGSDSFTFIVNDGTEDSEQATVTIETEAPVFDPFTAFGARLVQATWAPYEGPNTVPAGLAAYKVTGAAAYGDTLAAISEYSGGDVLSRRASTGDGAQLVDGGGGDIDHFNSNPDGTGGEASYQQDTTPIALNDDLSLVHVWRRRSLTQGGYMYQHGGFQPLFRLYTSSPYNIRLYHPSGNTDIPVGDTNWHITIEHRDTANTKTDVRHDGVVTNVAMSLHDFGASTTQNEFSANTGSVRSVVDQVGWFKIRGMTEAEAAQLEKWIADQVPGYTLGGVVNIAFPEAKAVFQRQGDGNGTIRARGTYDATVITGGVGLEARWAGAASWTACTLDAINETWTVELTGQAAGTGTLEVRSTDTTHTASVDEVGVGDVWFLIGQSNAGRISGASGNATYLGAAHAGVYDPINYTETGWGVPTNKWWRAQFLERARADRGVPVAIVSYYKGSTRLSQWLPGSAEDYLAEAYQVLLDSQGITVAYDAMTHGDLAVEMLCQWGERDSQFGSSAATVQANIEAIAGDANTNYGLTSRWSRVQVMDITYATAVNQAAYRTGVDNAVAANAFVLAGPDLEALTTPTQWTGTEGVHPATVVELDALGDEWADAVGLAA